MSTLPILFYSPLFVSFAFPIKQTHFCRRYEPEHVPVTSSVATVYLSTS